MIWTLCDWKMHTWGEDEKYQLGCPFEVLISIYSILFLLEVPFSFCSLGHFLTLQKNDILAVSANTHISVPGALRSDRRRET